MPQEPATPTGFWHFEKRDEKTGLIGKELRLIPLERRPVAHLEGILKHRCSHNILPSQVHSTNSHGIPVDPLDEESYTAG